MNHSPDVSGQPQKISRYDISCNRIVPIELYVEFKENVGDEDEDLQVRMTVTSGVFTYRVVSTEDLEAQAPTVLASVCGRVLAVEGIHDTIA